jgi:hypothetical protein
LCLPDLLIDCAVFLIAIYLTESGSTDFTSPFLSSFIFIILSATARWGWSGMAIAAGLLSSSYVATGTWLDLIGLDVELCRFGRRGTYMVLLSLILVWFGLQRRVRAVARLDLPGESTGAFPAAEIAAYATAATGAPSAFIAWWSEEDPQVLVSGPAPGASDIRPKRSPRPRACPLPCSTVNGAACWLPIRKGGSPPGATCSPLRGISASRYRAGLLGSISASATTAPASLSARRPIRAR